MKADATAVTDRLNGRAWRGALVPGAIGIVLVAAAITAIAGWIDWSAIANRLRPDSSLLMLLVLGVGFLAVATRRVLLSGRRDQAVQLLRWPTASAAAGVVVLVSAGAVAWLLAEATGAADPSAARIEAIKAGLTVGAGAGGVLALTLAVRRQWHQERVAAGVEHDAAERRVTELYTKAADQLGSDKAPVRLAGLYALERLAQDNPGQRQTIVNVLCAYLRMPFEPPPPLEKFVSEPTEHYDARQEREVRLTAQRILGDHLRKPSPGGPGSHHWSAMEINLAGAYLIHFALDTVAVRYAFFTKATFDGEARFWQAEFGGVNFEGAVFNAEADLSALRVRGSADFAKAEFAGRVNFDRASILGVATFGGASFGHSAIFAGAYLDTSTFTDARFGGYASFDDASFDVDPRWDGVRFAEPPSFANTTFGAHLDRAAAAATDSDTGAGSSPEANSAG